MDKTKYVFSVWIIKVPVSLLVEKERALEFLFPQPSRFRYKSRVKIQRKAGNKTRIDRDRNNRDWTIIGLDAK